MNETYELFLDAPMKKRVPHFGSFYLRIGAIFFGIGTLVYSGLELVHYFELKSNDDNIDCITVRIIKQQWSFSIFLFSDFHAHNSIIKDDSDYCANSIYL
jgi:hypothetical protein